MEYTENYHLPKWAMTDRIQMADFNNMTAALDTALTAEAAVRQSTDASLAAQVAKCGNCKIWIITYVGTGLTGASNPNRLTFPEQPALVWIFRDTGMTMCMVPKDGTEVNSSSGGQCLVTWKGSTVSWYVPQGPTYEQMNNKGETYTAIAFGKAG